MTPSWRTVRFGLRLILIGAQTIGWSLAAAFAIGCGGMALLLALKGDDFIGWVILVLFYTTLGTGILGRLLCAVGRWICLATPPEATKARARIRLTVIFETCSLLSGAATVGLAVSGILPAPQFALIGVCFWLLTTVVGRVYFFAFEWAVTEATQARASTDDARSFFRISLFTLGVTVLGVGLMAVANLVVGDDTAIMMLSSVLVAGGAVFLFVAAGCALYLFFAHFVLITDLRRHLGSYQPQPSEEDPDREYLERHLAGGGSADDT